ncbi:MAG: hypothetical protein QOG89_1230, partial [Thermomicrobiales bacterium]|nr:hypothetical protein [Thermomicrobiales bacterium]
PLVQQALPGYQNDAYDGLPRDDEEYEDDEDYDETYDDEYEDDEEYDESEEEEGIED